MRRILERDRYLYATGKIYQYCNSDLGMHYAFVHVSAWLLTLSYLVVKVVKSAAVCTPVILLSPAKFFLQKVGQIWKSGQ